MVDSLCRNTKKIIVIGIDGASFELILPFIEEGKLPNIKRFFNDGSWGLLESSTPAVTFPAWKCYSTGKNPGKLGAFHWETLDFDKQIRRFHNSKSFKSREVWDYLSDAGYRVAVVNMPSTYPPKEVNGVMVAGEPVGESQEYTYPKELQQKLVKEYNYDPHIQNSWDDGEIILEKIKEFTSNRRNNRTELISEDDFERLSHLLEKTKDAIQTRFNLAKDLLSEADFMHLTLFYVDDAQHYTWDLKEMLLPLWELIDDNIGKLIELSGSESNFFIMSDHGFTDLESIFVINKWLERKGYLVRPQIERETSKDWGFKASLIASIKKRYFRILDAFKAISKRAASSYLGSIIKKNVSSRLIDKLADFLKSGLYKIDMDKTKAIATGEGLIWINPDIQEPERSLLKDELVQEIRDIRRPGDIEPFFDLVSKSEDIYSGPYIDKAPDLVVRAKKKNIVWGTPNPEPYEVEWPQEFHWTGYHDLYGVFMALGPDIKSTGTELKNLKIYDLAPTILHMFDLPIPADIDGRVLKEIFREDSDVSLRQVKIETISESERLKEKVAALKRDKKV